MFQNINKNKGNKNDNDLTIFEVLTIIMKVNSEGVKVTSLARIRKCLFSFFRLIGNKETNLKVSVFY